MNPLLEIRNLQTSFHTPYGTGRAVNGVSFSMNKGEIIGLAGESGSGKTMTALSILRLLPENKVHISAEALRFNGLDLLSMTDEEMRMIRGHKISMIFQDPVAFLNPAFTIGQQLTDTILTHMKISKQEAAALAVETLSKVGFTAPEHKFHYYPHQLSGGMAQRTMIAQAIVTRPQLLIADEIATSLDATLQNQIIDLMLLIRQELSSAMILITHNLALISQMADRIAMMYAGEIVEIADKENLFRNPFHPYTIGLLESIPRIDKKSEFLKTIPGNIPDIFHYPAGCNFSDRCPRVMEICCHKKPGYYELSPGHKALCWLGERAATT
ncbi:MAG: ABC transporter ATP-binding protein [Candidatus Wallbacteria bacterium]|nr:ABC transporter ATP-binding protein [Candidatus Wallbacteria bacterium]